MLLGYNDLILVPIQIVVIIVLLHQALGNATFAGLGVMLLMLPIMGCVLVKIVALESKRLGLSDQRVKLQSEILHGIRIVKFYAYERSFMARPDGASASSRQSRCHFDGLVGGHCVGQAILSRAIDKPDQASSRGEGWSRHSDLNRGPAVYESQGPTAGAPAWAPWRGMSHGYAVWDPSTRARASRSRRTPALSRSYGPFC